MTGWRVWRLANDFLYSIANVEIWNPGENQAQCLARHNHDVPASSCHCGFWALHNPVSAMQLAAQVESGSEMWSFTPVGTPRTMAVGLILGYGAIAVHGLEGYRARFASVACIFSDAPEPPAPEHADLRRAVATRYGVPCITMEAAISIGFLHEMGIGSQAIEQLKVWLAEGRPLTRPEPLRTRPSPAPSRRKREAFLEELSAYIPMAYRLAFGLLKDGGRAEGAIQEAELVACRRRNQAPKDSRMGPWFLAIVNKECRRTEC